MFYREIKTFLARANMAMRENNYATAIELYEQACKEKPVFSERLQLNIEIARRKASKNQKKTGPITQSPPIIITNKTTSGHHAAGRNIRGNIDTIDGSHIHGWIYNANRPEDTISLDLFMGDIHLTTTKANLTRNDVKESGEKKAACGFSLDYGSHINITEFVSLEIFISGTEIPAFSQKITASPLPAQIEALLRIAKITKKQLFQTPDNNLHWLSSSLIPYLIQETRTNIGKNLPQYQTSTPHYQILPTQTVDVIIPVYDGHKETLDCINSVLQSKNKKQYNLIVINDCSPNPNLTEDLKLHSHKNNYTLIENERNLGFVGTANRGMRLNNDNDIILLNSDTLVPSGWIDQLISAAYSDPTIGTTTPFSNNATICSYPKLCQDNDLPTDYDVDTLNNIFQESNRSKTIDLPTAHGFCMHIKRAVINEIGFFDEKKWGKGYAEENDYSLRAEQFGWRNAIALGTFVQHLGSVSFAESANEYIEKNLKILNNIYPDYAARVSQFIKSDPIRAYRNTISLKILQAERAPPPQKQVETIAGKFILFVSLTIGGGTEVATDDLSAELDKEGIKTLLLTSPKAGIWRLASPQSNVFIDYLYPSEYPKLIADLKELRVWHIHYHNTIEFCTEVWDIPRDIDCRYDITTHDYFTACPRVNLIDETNKYCGAPSVDKCNACIDLNGEHESSLIKLSHFKDGIEGWRNFHNEKYKNARKVFAPSKDTANRISRYFKETEISIRPHPENLACVQTIPATANDINVAFIGAIGIHKGYEYLRGCAEHALRKSLPIKFHVIGYTYNDEEIFKLTNTTVYGRYERKNLPALIEKSRCTIAAILSTWPETFSYTFSEASRLGLKILTFDIGAPAERLQAGAGTAIPINASYDEICSEIIKLHYTLPVTIETGKTYNSYLQDYYNFSNVLTAQN